MNKPEIEGLKLLLVEDDEDFCHALISRLVKRKFEVTMALSAEEALDKFKSSRFDVIVADIKLPGMDGIGFLSRVRSADENLPVILVTGYASLESAKEAVKLNAADYLLKPLESIDELLDPIYKASYSYKLFLENKRLMDDLRVKVGELERAERKYRNLFELASDIIYIVDAEGIITSVNKRMEEITKYKREELIGKPAAELIASIEDEQHQIKSQEVLSGKAMNMIEVKIATKDGEERLGEMGMSPITEDDKIAGMQCIIHDITEHKKAEEALKVSEAQLRDQKISLEQKNVALKELLEQIEIEKKQIKDEIFANIDKLLLPMVIKLKKKATYLDVEYIDMLQRNLEEVTSSFGRRITEKSLRLTPREIEICNMVRNGLTSKEIATILNASLPTVERHRNNIRKKFDIVNKDVNLTTYLQMF